MPVRHTFNELAKAFIHEENMEKAQRVMEYAFENLYHPHLPPSYTNLESAEVLIMLGETDRAWELVQTLHHYSKSRIELEQRERRSPSRLDVFLLERSRELLAALDER